MQNRKPYSNIMGPVSMIIAAVCMIMLLPAPDRAAKNDTDGTLYTSVVRRPEIPHSPLPYRYGPGLAKGKLLVAGRYMQDPRFVQAVILIIQYDAAGAMGVIINRPLDVKLSRALPGFEGFRNTEDVLYWGGPVAFQQVAVLFASTDEPEDSFHVFGNVYYSASDSIFKEMANSKERSRTFRVYAGYAGWGPGQLDFEFLRGDWHVFRANAETIFEKNSSDIWKDLIIFDSGEQVFVFPEKP